MPNTGGRRHLKIFLRALAPAGFRPHKKRVKKQSAVRAVFLLAGKSYTSYVNGFPKNNIGKLGETIAVNYLKNNGYEILETNFENALGYRVGEIDVVARDPKNEEIIFVEVKTRRKNPSSPPPEMAVTRGKYRKLAKIISRYLNKHKMHDCDYRLDVIAIEMNTETRKACLRHLKYVYC